MIRAVFPHIHTFSLYDSLPGSKPNLPFIQHQVCQALEDSRIIFDLFPKFSVSAVEKMELNSTWLRK